MTSFIGSRSRALRMTAALFAASVSSIPFLASPAHAQFGGIVYDPTNYAQNL
jgi:conjugal transfer/entry exclusion protein